MENTVSHKEMLNLRKKEMLHRKWNERVYEPIRQQIDREMNSAMFHDLSKRKRELHKEYLEHVNKRVRVQECNYADKATLKCKCISMRKHNHTG